MDELRSVIVGDRRVRLLGVGDDRYSVTIEVRGPAAWEDISLRADQNLILVTAHQRYQLRVAEQHVRAREVGQQ